MLLLGAGVDARHVGDLLPSLLDLGPQLVQLLVDVLTLFVYAESKNNEDKERKRYDLAYCVMCNQHLTISVKVTLGNAYAL